MAFGFLKKIAAVFSGKKPQPKQGDGKPHKRGGRGRKGGQQQGASGRDGGQQQQGRRDGGQQQQGQGRGQQPQRNNKDVEARSGGGRGRGGRRGDRGRRGRFAVDVPLHFRRRAQNAVRAARKDDGERNRPRREGEVFHRRIVYQNTAPESDLYESTGAASFAISPRHPYGVALRKLD